MAGDPIALQAGLEKGLAYLARSQRADGGFNSYSSPSKTRFKKAFTYQTTFASAVILAALGELQPAATEAVKEHLVRFVQAQHGPGWSFNYWAADSVERQSRPYPDDLDDTACALIGLWKARPEVVGPDVLAAFVKLLLNAETQVGGPYRTWLAARESAGQWSDIDLAVNTNVAYLVSLVSRPLPNLTSLMEQAIRAAKLESSYYVSAHAIIYYLARAYQGPLVGRLRQQALELQGSATQPTPLQNALLLSALQRLGHRQVSALAEQLLATQRKDGSWPAAAFCLDPARDGTVYYHGSESLTTALALEALALYQRAFITESPLDTRITPLDHSYATFNRQLATANRRYWRRLPPELSDTGLAFTRRLAKAAIYQEIVTLAPAFNDSLTEPLPKTQQPALLQLGLANLYGWTAYTIYDDFLDDEGRPALLSVANAALRACLEVLAAAVPDDLEFTTFIRQTFDTIDGANAWELAHCRIERHGPNLQLSKLPDYGEPTRLAKRSLGHSLPVLAVLRLKGMSLQDQSFRSVQKALAHYLTAKQLNDDAHDWQTDLRNGHITYVVARLLDDAHIVAGPRDYDTLLPVLREHFWYEILPAICHEITGQTALSRQCLANVPELKPSNILTKLLEAIDASVADTLDTHRQTRTFLDRYKNRAQAAA